jgi:hypothetical protein
MRDICLDGKRCENLGGGPFPVRDAGLVDALERGRLVREEGRCELALLEGRENSLLCGVLLDALAGDLDRATPSEWSPAMLASLDMGIIVMFWSKIAPRNRSDDVAIT